MKLSKILAYIFAVIALIFEGFFGIVPFVSFILQVILLAFALFFLIWIFRRKNTGDWKRIIAQYTLFMTATIGFFTTFFLAFVQYQYLIPGVISDITLSHSGQQIVFVQMSHIASPEFYQNKKETIRALAGSGYTILVEGVRPGTPANQALFAQSLGFDLTPTLYGDIASLIGLVSQDNRSLFADISTGSLVSVDLSVDDIMTLMGTGAQMSQSGGVSAPLPDLGAEIIATRDSLSPRERVFVSWVGRGLLSWSLRRSDDLDTLLIPVSQTQLFATIIDRRNDAIIAYIQDHPQENIAIVYGALHFNGIYEALQRLSPAWQISHIENNEPYQL